MKILITGASCAGSTTLGKALSARLGWPVFDTDDYFWELSDVPYTVRRDPVLKNEMLKRDFASHENCIVSGSLVSWGAEWRTMLDLVVFLYIPHHIRIKRLKDREVERYGDAIFTDPVRIKLYHDFLVWATGYDDNTTNGRNLKVHRDWLSMVNCPVLEITGDTTVEERVQRIVQHLKAISLMS